MSMNRQNCPVDGYPHLRTTTNRQHGSYFGLVYFPRKTYRGLLYYAEHNFAEKGIIAKFRRKIIDPVHSPLWLNYADFYFSMFYRL